MALSKTFRKIGMGLLALIVMVATPGCGAPLSDEGYTYDCPKLQAPTLVQIIPDKVNRGQPDLLMIINGSNFDRRTVAFAGDKTQIILKTTFISSTQLTAWLPFDQMAKPGQVAISVTNVNGPECRDGQIRDSNFVYLEVQ